MKDFTLDIYGKYIEALQASGAEFLTFSDFILSDQDAKPERLVMLRHDVDRKPMNSLKMAKLEHQLGVKATYYFRDRSNIAKPSIMQEIESMGHEVGYHYECLSDSNGDEQLAYSKFDKALSKMREIVTILTISMHGSPLKPYDNRDMWRSEFGKQKLRELSLLGEIYLCIDYSDIAYVNDTGRNWFSGKSNRRDKVDSNIEAEFESPYELLEYFQKPHRNLIFQVHPERWTDNNLEWLVQLAKDGLINLAKIIIQILRR